MSYAIRIRNFHLKSDRWPFGTQSTDLTARNSTEIRMILTDFIKKTNLKGIPPTPGEAENTVTMVKYLKTNGSILKDDKHLIVILDNVEKISCLVSIS
jgi:hypothetical protein